MRSVSSSEPIWVFVCYARAEDRWVDPKSRHNLIPWLAESLRRQHVEFWVDRGGIDDGAQWREAIFGAIDRASIAILLIDQHFLNSDFIEQEELPRIRERAADGRLSIVPILTLPCTWRKNPFLERLQMLPQKVIPLIDCIANESQWEHSRVEILNAIQRKIDLIRSKPAAAASSPPRGENSGQRLDRHDTNADAAPYPQGSSRRWLGGIALAGTVALTGYALLHLRTGAAPVPAATPLPAQTASIAKEDVAPPPKVAVAPTPAKAAPAPTDAGASSGTLIQGATVYLLDSTKGRDEVESDTGTNLMIGTALRFEGYVQDGWIHVTDDAGKNLYLHPSADLGTTSPGRQFVVEGLGTPLSGYLVGGAFSDLSGASTTSLLFIDVNLGETEIRIDSIEIIKVIPDEIRVQAIVKTYDGAIYSGKALIPAGIVGMQRAYLVTKSATLALDEIKQECSLRPVSHPANAGAHRTNPADLGKGAPPPPGTFRCAQSMPSRDVPCEIRFDDGGIIYQNRNMASAKKLVWSEITKWSWKDSPYDTLNLNSLYFRLLDKDAKETALRYLQANAADRRATGS